MRSVGLLLLVALGCAGPNPPASAARQEAPPSAEPTKNAAAEPTCEARCRAYHYFRRGNQLTEWEKPEVVQDEHDLRDSIIAECGDTCPEAVADARPYTPWTQTRVPPRDAGVIHKRRDAGTPADAGH
jgi:hypothetical protein